MVRDSSSRPIAPHVKHRSMFRVHISCVDIHTIQGKKPDPLFAIKYLNTVLTYNRCLGDSLECTECASENTTLMEIRRSQEQTSMQHDQFFRQLEGSTDGFSVIAEYFGRNAFQVPST